MKQITLDGNKLADASLVHDYLKEMLAFPEYYGNNLDALYDCLTDLSDMEIVITAPAEDGAFFRRIRSVFTAAASEDATLVVTFL